MSTRQLLEYILQRDHIKARKVFEDLMVDRLRDVVDTKKMEVGMKIMHVEEEQIDELSKKTLMSYRDKAFKSMHKAIDDTMDAKGSEAKAEKYKKYSKRFDGIKSANKRLSK